MIRILIDELRAERYPNKKHKQRAYTIEIIQYVDMEGRLGYSAWLHDRDGVVIMRVELDGVTVPESNPLRLLSAAVKAFEKGNEDYGKASRCKSTGNRQSSA